MDVERRPDGDGPAPAAADPAADASGPDDALLPSEPDSSTPLVDWGAPPPDVKSKWTYEKPPGWTGLDVMSVFGRSVDTLLGHWPTFALLTLPSAILSLLVLVVVPPVIATASRQPTDFIGLLYFPVSIYLTTTVAMAADDARAGRPVSARAVLGPAVVRTIIGMISAIAVALCIFGLSIGPILLLGIFSGGRGTGSVILGILIVLFLVTLILFTLFRWSLGPMAIALDGAGPVSALNRSWRITKGNLWRLGVLFLGIAVLGAPWSFAGSLFLFGDSVPLGAAIGFAGTLVFGALSGILTSIAFGDITGRPRADLVAASRDAPLVPAPYAGPYAADASGAPVAAVASVAAAEAVNEELAPPPPVAWAPEPLAPPTEPRPAAPRSRISRRAYVLGVFIIGLVLLVPGFAVAIPAIGNVGFAGVPFADRGKIFAGTDRDPVDPCALKSRGTTFTTTDSIYVGGYFTRAILPGREGTVHVIVDDVEQVALPIAATTQAVGCYYELESLILPVGEYRIVIDDDIGLLAEGTFRVE